MQLLGVRDLLRDHPRYRRLWLAQCVSELGDWFQVVALVTLFPTAGGGAAMLAGLWATRYLTSTLVAPFAGVLADRVPRGRILVAADLARAAFALGLTQARGPEDAPLVFALVFAIEAGTTCFEPARGAVVPQIVPREGLAAANALGGATWSAMLAFGALLGGIVSAHFGRRAAFVVDAASFLLSAALVWSARLPGRVPPEPGASRATFAEGLRYLRAHRPQATMALVKPGALLAGGFVVVVSALAEQVFAGDPAVTTGFFFGARGVGAFAGPFVAARLSGRGVPGQRRAIRFAFPLAAVAFAGFALAPHPALACVGLFVAYACTSTAWVGSAHVLQVTVPNAVLGRVLSLEYAVMTTSLVVSSSLAGVLLSRLGFAPRAAGLALAALLLVPAAAYAIAERRVGARLDAAANVAPDVTDPPPA